MIVSVFGKSQYRAKGCKTGMLSSVLQVDLLDEPTIDESLLVKIDLKGFIENQNYGELFFC